MICYYGYNERYAPACWWGLFCEDIMIGATRVALYFGEVVVEELNYHGLSDPFWAVPDWVERGIPELAGPFESFDFAQGELEVARCQGQVPS